MRISCNMFWSQVIYPEIKTFIVMTNIMNANTESDYKTIAELASVIWQ